MAALPVCLALSTLGKIFRLHFEILCLFFPENKIRHFMQIVLFSGKNKKNTINLSSAENAQRVVKVRKIYISLIVLGFNNTSTLLGHFVSSPKEREKRDRRDSREAEREGQGRKRNRKESEETEEIRKHSPQYPYLLKG